MCFKLRYEDKKPRVAKQDIVCWKILRMDNRSPMYDLVIDRKEEAWTPGYIYWEKSQTFRKSSISQYKVNGGCFHSKRMRKLAKISWIMDDGDKKVVKMIIPKGAKYYENDEEYVSDTIWYPHQRKKKEKEKKK